MPTIPVPFDTYLQLQTFAIAVLVCAAGIVLYHWLVRK